MDALHLSGPFPPLIGEVEAIPAHPLRNATGQRLLDRRGVGSAVLSLHHERNLADATARTGKSGATTFGPGHVWGYRVGDRAMTVPARRTEETPVIPYICPPTCGQFDIDSADCVSCVPPAATAGCTAAVI